MWDTQFADFAQEYHVLRYDIRGRGRSTFPDLPFANEQDLVSLLSALGINKTILLGLYLGAWTAVDFTLQHPEMVEALILAGAAVGGLPPELQPKARTSAHTNCRRRRAGTKPCTSMISRHLWTW